MPRVAAVKNDGDVVSLALRELAKEGIEFAVWDGSVRFGPVLQRRSTLSYGTIASTMEAAFIGGPSHSAGAGFEVPCPA